MTFLLITVHYFFTQKKNLYFVHLLNKCYINNLLSPSTFKTGFSDHILLW